LFAGVLLVLVSWARRSLRIANVCRFSPALLYGLLYKEVESSEIGAVLYSAQFIRIDK
jgi:hypothetical protein